MKTENWLEEKWFLFSSLMLMVFVVALYLFIYLLAFFLRRRRMIPSFEKFSGEILFPQNRR